MKLSKNSRKEYLAISGLIPILQNLLDTSIITEELCDEIIEYATICKESLIAYEENVEKDLLCDSDNH